MTGDDMVRREGQHDLADVNRRGPCRPGAASIHDDINDDEPAVVVALWHGGSGGRGGRWRPAEGAFVGDGVVLLRGGFEQADPRKIVAFGLEFASTVAKGAPDVDMTTST
jgi:hypothetical protein